MWADADGVVSDPAVQQRAVHERHLLLFIQLGEHERLCHQQSAVHGDPHLRAHADVPFRAYHFYQIAASAAFSCGVKRFGEIGIAEMFEVCYIIVCLVAGRTYEQLL